MHGRQDAPDAEVVGEVFEQLENPKPTRWPRLKMLGRLALPATQLALGISLGSMVGSGASCTDTKLGGQATEICTDMNFLDWSGGANVDLGLVDDIEMPETHDGPYHVTVRPEVIDLKNPAVKRLTEDTDSLEVSLTAFLSSFKSDIEPAVSESVAKGMMAFMAVNIGIWTIGPAYARFKRYETDLSSIRRHAILGTGIGLASLVPATGLGLATLNEDPLESAYSEGLLSHVGDVSQDIQTVVANYEQYGEQIADKTRYAYELYTAAGNLPGAIDRDNVVRAMVVSDRHLNTSVDPMLRAVAATADIDVVLDLGDDSDYGSPLENSSYEVLSEFEDENGDSIQVLWVQGNHERPSTVEVVRRLKNVTVMEGQLEEIDGLGFVGLGDKRYSPSTSQDESINTPIMEEMKNELAEAALSQDAEVIMVHDNKIAEELAKAELEGVGSVTGGHGHVRKDSTHRNSDGYTNLHIEGSTGAEGARVLEGKDGTPGVIQLSILSFDKVTGRIVSGELITVDAYGSEPVVTISNMPAELLYKLPEMSRSEDEASTNSLTTLLAG